MVVSNFRVLEIPGSTVMGARASAAALREQVPPYQHRYFRLGSKAIDCGSPRNVIAALAAGISTLGLQWGNAKSNLTFTQCLLT